MSEKIRSHADAAKNSGDKKNRQGSLMMGIKEFAQYIRTESILYLPETYQKQYVFSLHQEQKCYGLQFADNREHFLPMPQIHVNRLYGLKDYKEELKKETAVYVHAYEQAVAKENKIRQELQQTAEAFPEDKVFFRLLLAKDYESHWKNRLPATANENVVFVYQIFLGIEDGILISCPVHMELFQRWHTDVNTLHQAAKRNMPRLFPYTTEKINGTDKRNVYIVSNRQAWHGLSSIFYEEGPLKEIASEEKQGLYIAALSVHEAAVFPEKDFSSEEIKGLLRPYALFSHRLYHYVYDSGELII